MTQSRRRHLLRLALLAALLPSLGLAACTTDIAHSESPDSRWEVVISEGTWVLDPVWDITLQATAIFGGSTDLGRFLGDDPRNG